MLQKSISDYYKVVFHCQFFFPKIIIVKFVHFLKRTQYSDFEFVNNDTCTVKIPWFTDKPDKGQNTFWWEFLMGFFYNFDLNGG